MNKAYQHVFTPYKIGNLEIKNRIALAPLNGFGASDGNGSYSEAGREFFIERAKGGTGLLFTGVVFADTKLEDFNPAVHISPLYNSVSFISSASILTERVHSYDCKIFLQITMGFGRNGSPGDHKPAPSVLPLSKDPNRFTRALTGEEIKYKIKAVIDAAGIAKQAGFDGVEIHAIHEGYLLDEFAMEFMNYRTDEYGGAFENRMRPAVEILQGIKEKNGWDYPVCMRLGLKAFLKDFYKASLHGEEEAGRTLEEGIRIGRYLEEAGYDALSVDSGVYDSWFYVHPPMYLEKGFNLPMAAELKKQVSIPVLTAGRIDEPDLCERAIEEGATDGVCIGRGLLADAYFVQKMRIGKPETIRPCLSCHMACMGRASYGKVLGCAVNPAVYREGIYGIDKAPIPKSVIVAGGGVGGMEAARVLKERGHDVTLFEKKGALGGHLIAGSIPDFKQDEARLLEWYENELKRLEVKICLNTEVDVHLLYDKRPDAVVIATGSRPVIPDIPGAEREKVLSCVDALLSKKPIGDRVAVIGGGLVGCEYALHLSHQNKMVTILETAGELMGTGMFVPVMNRSMLLALLEESENVDIRTGCRAEEITEEGVKFLCEDGTENFTFADTVVTAVGFQPERELYQQCRAMGTELYCIGDSHWVSNIMNAIWEAYEVARSI